MKIYTLLFGLLLPIQPSAQTVHDWENHHVLQINREPARAAFTLSTHRREIVPSVWMEHGSFAGHLCPMKEL